MPGMNVVTQPSTSQLNMGEFIVHKALHILVLKSD
jgi:hypothetical protein